MGPSPRTPESNLSCTLAGASSPEHPHTSGAVHTHTHGPWRSSELPAAAETLSRDSRTKCIKRC